MSRDAEHLRTGLSPRSRALPAPVGLLGTLLLVLLIEALFLKIDRPPFATNATMNWRFAKTVIAEAARCELLLFGDSQVQFELLPAVLEERTGLRSYNLGLHSGPPSAAYFQLRRVLAAGGRPRAVVVDFTSHGMGVSPQGQARVWMELLTPGEILELARTAEDFSFGTQVFLGQVLPSYRLRYEIQTGLKTLLKGQDLQRSGLLWLVPLVRNWTTNRGANVLPVNPVRPSGLRPEDSWLLFDVVHHVPVSVQYMRKFLDLTVAHGIDVYWLLPPVHPLVWDYRKAHGIEDRYTAFVHAVQAEYRNVMIVDARDAGFRDEVFFDLAHLDRRGAVALSDGVGQVVHEQRSRAARRADWVALPPFRAPDGNAPIEDINESRVALRIFP